MDLVRAKDDTLDSKERGSAAAAAANPGLHSLETIDPLETSLLFM